MALPDVRVRLTAEGLQEVVTALRKVRTESESATRGASGAFSQFGASLRGLNGLLIQLGAAVGVAQLISFARGATDAADEIGKMAQRVGASVENLSALRL